MESQWTWVVPEDAPHPAHILEGLPTEETHAEIAAGVWVARRYTAYFLNKRRGLLVRIDAKVNEDGAPIVGKLEVEADASNRRGVDREQLRDVPVTDLLERATAAHSWVRGEKGWGTHVVGEGLPGAREAIRRQGRRITRQELERVAEVYRSHEGRSPVQAVAEDRGIARSTAAKHVMRAREAGLLPPTERGRATNREQ